MALLVLVGLYCGAVTYGGAFTEDGTTVGWIVWGYFGFTTICAVVSLVAVALKSLRAAWVVAGCATVFGIVATFMGGFCTTFVPVVLTATCAVALRNFDLGERMRDIAANVDEAEFQ